tara:strand:+ start:588 stop:1541 length:954 start_codon:yes stop_codon:yes gene_type:complete
MEKFVVVSLLFALGISGGAEAASKKYKTLEELKIHLHKQALGDNKASDICKKFAAQPSKDSETSKKPGWFNKSSNIIQSSELIIESSDMEAVSTKYSNDHLKVTKTTKRMGSPKCVDVYAETTGQNVTIKKVKQNVASSSATSKISEDISFGAGVSASAGVYSANVDVNYGTTSTKSKSVSDSVSDSDQSEYTLPLTYVKDHGPYSASFHTLRYTTNGSATLDVTYRVKGLKITAQCEYVSNKSKKHVTNTDTIDLKDFKTAIRESEYEIPTKVTFNVDYVDQWPSYDLSYMKTCNGDKFSSQESKVGGGGKAPVLK